MFNQRFPTIYAEGTPYKLGYIHGSEAKKQILVSIATYKAMFEDYSNIAWDDAITAAKKYVAIITDYDEALLEEMHGVADGADVNFEDILALNARSEIVLTGKYLEGCTSLAFKPEMTDVGDTIIGQNWDWKSTQKDAFIMLKLKQKNKPNVIMLTEAGIIGKIGFNSAGLGLCINALASNKNPVGLPFHLALRGILNSRTICDAIRFIGNVGVACPAHFLIGHKNGEVVTIESVPEDFDVIYGSNNYITHTNHFISSRFTTIKDTGKLIFPDTFVRLGRANRLIGNLNRRVTYDDIKTIFSDHIEYPNSICRHEDENVSMGMRMSTVFSIIMNLGKMEMEFCLGQPCVNKYTLLHGQL